MSHSRTADKFVVRMPDDMRDQMHRAANQEFISMNTFVIQAVAEKLDRDKLQEIALIVLARAAHQVTQPAELN